jgi:hypothetical protein
MIAAAITFGCRDDPPEKEIQQAQGAIDAARAAGADQYAHDEVVAADEALKHAREAIADRDYRLALNHALDSREHAQNAAKQAADNKAMARADADRAIVEAMAALGDARARLRSGEAAQAPAKASALRRAVIDTDAAVQKARAAFEAGDYRVAARGLRDVTPRLRAARRDLDAAAAAAARRRR